MPRLAQRFPSDVETANKPHDSFKKRLGKRNQDRVISAFLSATVGKNIGLTVVLHQHKHTDCA